MDVAVRSLKETFLPGSVGFLILGMAAGVALLFVRGAGERWGRRWLSALVFFYWFLAIPVGMHLLYAGLTIGIPSWSPEASRDADVIVVLDSDTAKFQRGNHRVEAVLGLGALRALEAVRVYEGLGNGRPVIVTGGTVDPRPEWEPAGSAMRKLIVEAGVPAERVMLDSNSLTTRESAVHISEWLRQRHMRRVILVTSASHIRRATMAFRAEGVNPIPAPVAEPEQPGAWISWLLPSRAVYQRSEGALYDYFGLAYYWTRGWVARR